MSKHHEDLTFVLNKMKEEKNRESLSRKVWKEGEKERRIRNLGSLAKHIRDKEKLLTKLKVKQYEVTLYIRKDATKAWRKFESSIDLAWVAIQRKLRYVLREDEWMCTRCGIMNYKDRRDCINCKAINRDADRSDDWYCPKDDCCKSNYGTRLTCHKCGTARKESQETFATADSGFHLDLRVQVSNLNYLTTEDDIKQFFQPLEMEHIVVCKSLNDKPNGRMNVYFKSRADAELAVKRHNSMLDGRVVRLHLAELTRIDPDMCAPDEEFVLVEDTETEESKNFKWNKMMLAILSRCPDKQLDEKLMRKKLFTVFKKLNPETETNKKQFREMLSEKLQDNKKVVLDDDVIKLKS